MGLSEGFENLRMAVIGKAAEDYITALKGIRNGDKNCFHFSDSSTSCTPDCNPIIAKDQYEDFFRTSPWMDGYEEAAEEIISRCREEAGFTEAEEEEMCKREADGYYLKITCSDQVENLLKAPYRLQKKIAKKKIESESLMESATRTTSELHDDVVSRTRNVHSNQDIIIRKADIDAQIMKLEDDVANAVRSISVLISFVPDPEMRAVCRYRYINCMNWESIAIKTGKSRQTIMNLSKRAISIMKEVVEKSFKK